MEQREEAGGAWQGTAVPAGILFHMPAITAGGGCGPLLAECAAAAEAALALVGDDRELQRTLAELALLCRTTHAALAIGARTSRDLRLICAALCDLCAGQCSGRIEPWARRLAGRCRPCAQACREVMSLGRLPG